MFSKILYPTDFSDTAGKCVDYLKQLRLAGAKQVVVLNVIHQRILDTLETIHKTVYFQDGRYQEDLEGTLSKMVAKRTNEAAPLAADLETAGFDVEVMVTSGHPVKEIRRVEKEREVTAIVMGSHGKSNIRRARLGTVAEKVVRRSSVPVLIIKR